MRSSRVCIGLGLAWVLASTALFALDPSLPLGQYLHTSWTTEQGMDLSAVPALAQTSDGYLWLGTARGLFRFDGMRFTLWQPSSGEDLVENVRLLVASRQGGLWIGTDKSVFRMDRGKLKRMFSGGVPVAREDHLGRLWVTESGSPRAITLLTPDKPARTFGPADGLPAGNIQAVLEDSRFNLWLGTDSGLCRWSPGSAAECVRGPRMSVLGMAETSPANLLLIDGLSRGIVRFSEGRLESANRPQGDTLFSRTLLQDRDGNIWVASSGHGLERQTDGKLERFTRKNGLSSDSVLTLLEDSEGDIWVGTTRGLDRFIDRKSLQMSTAEGLSGENITTVARGANGAMWAGTMGSGINRVSGKTVSQFQMDSGLPAKSIISLGVDSGGKLWAGTGGGLACFSNGRFFEVLTADGNKLTRVLALTNGPDGAFWVGTERDGLFVVRDQVAHPLHVPGLQTQKHVFRLYRARNNTLWAGYFEGGVSAIEGNGVRSYDQNDGLVSGTVQDIVQDRSGAIWVGASGGVSRFRNGVWTSWTAKHGIPDPGIREILEDDAGTLWFITAGGISRVALATLDQSPDGSPHQLNFPVYGPNEGVHLPGNVNMANPRGAMDEEGRLWIATRDGIAIIDPKRIRTNPVPPPVAIEQMLVDGNPMPEHADSEIRFRGASVRFTYTGLSLRVPERVRFKYMLEGQDSDWTDAGEQRSSAYTNLGPGKYRFRVIAANNDGVWNLAGASQPFYVIPHFYQTYWFYVLCFAMTTGTVWGVYRFRMHQLVVRFHLVAAERARLTRELHDSLMQGFSGVVYQLQAVLRQFDSAPEASKKRLARAIDNADSALEEARRALQAIRIPELENNSLPEALSYIAAKLIEGTSIEFHLAVKGQVIHLPYEAQADVFKIGSEAIANSVTHSRATRIEAGLDYSDKELQLLVRDDGTGFDPETTTSKPGHLGMTSMRERADRMGAKFSIDSRPGAGTRIQLVVPRKGLK